MKHLAVHSIVFLNIQSVEMCKTCTYTLFCQSGINSHLRLFHIATSFFILCKMIQKSKLLYEITLSIIPQKNCILSSYVETTYLNI